MKVIESIIEFTNLLRYKLSLVTASIEVRANKWIEDFKKANHEDFNKFAELKRAEASKEKLAGRDTDGDAIYKPFSSEEEYKAYLANKLNPRD